MKNKISFGLILAFSLFAGIGANAASKCWFWDVECKVKEVLEKLENGSAPGPNAQQLCQKGVASEFIFSARSFEGRLCAPQFYLPEGLTKLVVGVTQAICPKVAADFGSSACNTNGTAFLKAKKLTAMEAIKQGLEETKGKAADALKTGFCAVGTDLPGASLICGKKE